MPKELQLGGTEQSLYAGGIVAACAASIGAEPEWLQRVLAHTLGENALELRPGAIQALKEQANEIVRAQSPIRATVEIVDSYLSSADFAPGAGISLITTVLAADVSRSGVYDARTREMLLRVVGALDLPPRILFDAELQLANLVAVLDRSNSGDSIDSQESDEDRKRRNRRWMKIGGASIVGGIALGVSGGLLAPAIIPALGSVGLASAAAPLAAMGSSGAMAVGGIFGITGASIGGAAMANRTGGVNEFQFEQCTVLDEDGNSSASVFEKKQITPTSKTLDVRVPVKARDGLLGGLLAWEYITSQSRPMVVPAGMGFSVLYETTSVKDENLVPSWVLPEEKADAGGLDEKGKGKRRRRTGAVTVVEQSGTYILRFRLFPGSFSVDIQYRVALVPPGKDPPLWLMQENEVASLGNSKDLSARSLTCALLIPGLLDADDSPQAPGIFADQFTKTVARLNEFSIEAFALRWESQLLHDASRALHQLVTSVGMALAAHQGAKMMLPSLAGAVALPMTLISALRSSIDNVWATTLSRARSCGYMLAAELATRSFGHRPIVLAGYSAGAVVIFSCLQELARRKLTGIVHDVFLIGSPCTADTKKWIQIRKVVSGRLVNAYLPGDWYLEFFHRSAFGDGLISVAGTGPIRECAAHVENCDLSSFGITSHKEYTKRVNEILFHLGLGDGEKKIYWQCTKNKRTEDDVLQANGIDCMPGVPQESNIVMSEIASDDDVVAFESTAKGRLWRTSPSSRDHKK